MTPREFVLRYATRSLSGAPEAESLVTDPGFRVALYREIHSDESVDARVLLRELLDKEIDYRRDSWEKPIDPDEPDYFENIYWCGFLLYRCGDPQDALQIWRAKNLNMDTSCGTDAQSLVGGGVEETIQYLRDQPGGEAKEAIEYVLMCKSSGEFHDLKGWFQWRDSYYKA